MDFMMSDINYFNLYVYKDIKIHNSLDTKKAKDMKTNFKQKKYTRFVKIKSKERNTTTKKELVVEFKKQPKIKCQIYKIKKSNKSNMYYQPLLKTHSLQHDQNRKFILNKH